MAKTDYRSPEAAEYRKLYKSTAWTKGLRPQQLALQPLCERCLKRSKIVPATVVNHKVPHKGSVELFFDATNLESTCKPCHDGAIQSEERIGYSNDIDPASGWPTDNNHPANR